jgi:hypothetical protein
MTTVAEKYGMTFVSDVLRQQDVFIAGVECEIEAVANPLNFKGFTVTQDGSLRNKHAPKGHGHEFISFPLVKEDLFYAFDSLHQQLKYYEGEDPFSARTSTHVHVNVLHLSLEQVKQLLLLYALFEEFFFAMVNPDRRDNIHCVPLTDTTLPARYHKPLHYLIDEWHKYTAFNMIPVRKYGSIEFRHLHGTNDGKLFREWINTLENLWKLAQTEPLYRNTLVSEDKLFEWFDSIFVDSPRIKALRPSMMDVIKNNLIDVKLGILA